MQDPIADMLSRIRNGYRSKLLSVLVPHSNPKVSILKTLQAEGYIVGFECVQDKNGLSVISVKLKYSTQGQPALKIIDRMSKPGRRMYTQVKDLREYRNGLGVYILSTPKGVMSGKEAAHYHVGGEIICRVF